jgi:anti-sigma factor RsiW
MTLEWDKGQPPAPEELMAFADGELGPARHEEVAKWLVGRPDAQGQVDEFRRLGQLWRNAQPPEPSPQAWAAALARIENALPPSTPLPRPRPRRPAWTFPALAAAAVLGVVLLSRSLAPVGTPTNNNGSSTADDEPYPIVAANEINIVGMDAQDADALVGHPPLSGTLEFAAPADVRLLNAQPHRDDGRIPQMGDGDVPMIVAVPHP